MTTNNTAIKRFYFALTNACNRSCDYCCCFSRSNKKTFLKFEQFKEILPDNGFFEIQLEGGEPLLHPDIKKMIHYAQDTERCKRVVLGSNAVLLPYKFQGGKIQHKQSVEMITDFFLEFKTPFVFKPSINYFLFKEDPLHLEKAIIIKESFSILNKTGEYELTFNVRRRKSPACDDNDQWLIERIKEKGLFDNSNIFFFQRYGFAENRQELELPFIIDNPVEFYLISPDGRNWKTDLLARSRSMKYLE